MKTPLEYVHLAEHQLESLEALIENRNITVSTEEAEQLREELRKLSSTIGMLWHQLNIQPKSDHQP